MVCRHHLPLALAFIASFAPIVMAANSAETIPVPEAMVAKCREDADKALE